jgi:hypothetical protein
LLDREKDVEAQERCSDRMALGEIFLRACC